MNECQEVPLVELLRSIPVDFVYKRDTPNPLGVDTSHIPVGWHCHAAANEIDRLRIGHDRYEIVRRMHVPMFKDAVQLSIRTGKPFDQIIDELKPFAPT